jgi:serine protease Do
VFEIVRQGPSLPGDELMITPFPIFFTPTLVVTEDGEFVASGSATSGSFRRRLPTLRTGEPLAKAVQFVLKTGEDRPRPWMGVADLTAASKDIREVYEVPEGRGAIMVGYVVENFPAADAGIKAKDLIIGFDGNPVVLGATEEETQSLFTDAMRRYEVGASVPLELWRDGKSVELSITLGEAPETRAKADRFYSEKLGMAVRELVFEDIYALKLKQEQPGVIVDMLKQSGPAETGEMNRSDVITKIGDAQVATVADFERIVSAMLESKPKEIVVSGLRGASQSFVNRVELKWDES